MFLKFLMFNFLSRKSYTEELDALFASAHSELNPFTIRFAFCEALNTHGYVKEASQVAYELAIELFNNPPNTLLVLRHLEKHQLSDEFVFEEDYVANYSGNNRTTKKPPLDTSKFHKISELVATTLWRTIYLIKILVSVETSTKINSFILEFALRMLKNPRGPASTRYLEVYIQSLVWF